MKRQILIAALVALSALPVVAAHTGGSSFDAPSVDTSTAASQATATASSSGSSSTAASGSGSAASSQDGEAEWNYTKLYVDAENGHLDLKPGESEEFTVTVGNQEDESVTVDPHVYVPPTRQHPIDESWLSIDGETTIAAGEETEFTVSVTVPDDAEIGHYRGMIAFTDERITYPGRPPRPVHAAHVGIEVWEEPTVTIKSATYVRGQVEAGDSITREITIENTGESAVPLSPELADQQHRCHGSRCPVELDPSWITIDAPSEIGAGETATVTVTMAPSADAERGRYNTELDLGLKDPARPEQGTYWQQIRLNYVVWKQPAEPFETTVDVSNRTDELTLTLSPRSTHHRGADAGSEERASFDVEFVRPDGETVDAERVRVTDRGSVDLSGDDRRSTADGDYAVRDGGEQFVYRVDDPQAGDWTVRVMPHNTIGFNYELERTESD